MTSSPPFILFAICTFVLEVLGSGGAVWGFTEAMGIRTVTNAEWWRYCAKVMTLGFFVRWMNPIMTLLFITTTSTTTDNDEEDITDDNSNEYDDTAAGIVPMKKKKMMNNTRDDDNDNDNSYYIFVIEACIQFVLEVMGATGAIWGCSIVVKLHTVGVNDFIWRPIALMVGLFFFLRWIHRQYYQLLLLCHRYHDDESSNNDDDKEEEYYFERWVRKFILEVMGATGAIWGFSNVMGWHNSSSDDSSSSRSQELLWRQRALGIGGIFFFRFVIQLKNSIQEKQCQIIILTLTQWQRLMKKFLFDLCGCLCVVGGVSMLYHLRTNDADNSSSWWWPCIYTATAVLVLLRLGHSYVQECSLSMALMKAEEELTLVEEEEEDSTYVSIFGSSVRTNSSSALSIEETTPMLIRQNINTVNQ